MCVLVSELAGASNFFPCFSQFSSRAYMIDTSGVERRLHLESSDRMIVG